MKKKWLFLIGLTNFVAYIIFHEYIKKKNLMFTFFNFYKL